MHGLRFLGLLLVVAISATSAHGLTMTPTATATPVATANDYVMSCSTCGDLGVPCRLAYGASGRVRGKHSGLPVVGARVEVDGLPAVFTDAEGHYQIGGGRDETCNIDYRLALVVTAEGYGFFAATLYSSITLLFGFDIELDELPPTPTPTPTCTPGPNPDPGCGYEGPTFTPTPIVPVLAIEPTTLHLQCEGAFDVRLSNSGAPGTVLIVESVSLSHGYSQGYYGTGFHWDLDGLVFPVSLESGASISIPITYLGNGSYSSRLHVRVTSNTTTDYRAERVYLGDRCPTQTPTAPGEPTPTATSSPPGGSSPTATPSPTATLSPTRTVTVVVPPTATVTSAPSPGAMSPPSTSAGSSGGCAIAWRDRDGSPPVLLLLGLLGLIWSRARVSTSPTASEPLEPPNSDPPP